MQLKTTYNGREAPGGSFDRKTRIYTKKINSPQGGRHPRTGDLGGIDSDIIQKLKALRCEVLYLQLFRQERHFIPFSVFMEKGYEIHWRDERFPPRWYCPSVYWCNSFPEAKTKASAAATKTKRFFQEDEPCS